MKKYTLLFLSFLILSSHDMFLKLDNYYLQPFTMASILLYNGTIGKSDNVINRNRMKDASLLGEGTRISIDSTQWRDEEKTTI